MFLEMLRDMRNGQLPADAGERIREVVQAVKATGKAGKLVMTITIKPAAKGDNNALLVSDNMKVTLPQLAAGETVLFAHDNGALSRRDPRQPELRGLAEVVNHRTRQSDDVAEPQTGTVNQ